MDTQQTILRMELQIGQLIRLVANLNERLEQLEEQEQEKTIQRALQLKRMSSV